MRIELTETARVTLASLAAAGKERPLRINGELVGGCGMTVEYSLVWDDPLPQDELHEKEGLCFLLDRETKEFIGAEQLTIDYRENQGFRLVTPHQILAYCLKVKERWL